MEVYGDSRGSIAKMTSVLVQYGLGFGVARQIAKRLITKVAKTTIENNEHFIKLFSQ